MTATSNQRGAGEQAPGAPPSPVDAGVGAAPPSSTPFDYGDDPKDPCALCASFVCAYCRLGFCEDDECPGVFDGAMLPIHPDGSPVYRMYRGTHSRCQAALDAYLEECRRDPY